MSTFISSIFKLFTSSVDPKHDKMLSQFQSSYERVEKSLERLTESIAAYNPSASAADELVAADNVVNENLEQCTPCGLLKAVTELTMRSSSAPIESSANTRA